MTDKELVERYRMALEAIVSLYGMGTSTSQIYAVARKALEVK